MSDQDPTAEQRDPRSFEERVFARFDSLDARLTTLEETAERKQMETKPIWERALAEILALRKDVEARFDALDVRLDRMEAVAHGTQSKFHALRADFNEFKQEIREHFPAVK